MNSTLGSLAKGDGNRSFLVSSVKINRHRFAAPIMSEDTKGYRAVPAALQQAGYLDVSKKSRQKNR